MTIITTRSAAAMPSEANAILTETPYVSYSYAYPHKTAYRLFETPKLLREVWQPEKLDSLFLYMHVPFCEMRCGFCNLFTTINPQLAIETAYLDALEQEARQVWTALNEAASEKPKFARFAIGGGTPTYLTVPELNRLFNLAENLYGLDLAAIPISVETSPQTATAERLEFLRQRSVDRISIGVQSFNEAEVRSVGRSQRTSEVVAALERIKASNFPILNIDLIYGLPCQDVKSWLASLKFALKFAPEELYLYPLYNRPLTGIGRQNKSWSDLRLECYRAGREFLLDAGYEQISMRMFRVKNSIEVSGPVYCCQEDGMVGLGCGARSYTRSTHYSSEYAVSASGVRAILGDYIKRFSDSEMKTEALANYGFELDSEEQRCRFVIQSLLQIEGLSFGDYQQRFNSHVLTDLPQLQELINLDLAYIHKEQFLYLTAGGLERSDAIGPWLYSSRVRQLMNDYKLS